MLRRLLALDYLGALRALLAILGMVSWGIAAYVTFGWWLS